MRRGVLATAAVSAALLLAAPAARADLASLKAACDPQLRNAAPEGAPAMTFRFCDDGIPDFGGTKPNVGAVKAVAVPAKYAGFIGLPAQAADAASVPGADPTGRIALDVDVSLPDPARHPAPASGWPVIVFMHGCCAGNKRSWEGATIESGGAETWHYNNAWFASRGYVVVNYTARGFVSSDQDGNKGSTGQTQIDDVRYEINDYQHLVGQLADDSFFNVDPQRVVVTGGSYGGGFSWLAFTDPVWQSPGGKDMRVVAAAPKYGWTDLAYSLVTNGAHPRDALPAFDGSATATPIGFPKQSIVAALYASGKTGVPPGTGSHATFPPEIDSGISCLSSSDPFESNPLCATTMNTLLPEFIGFRSAYYQDHFWAGLAAGTIAPVPVYSAGTLTDQLFTSVEHTRMAERLRATRAGYPIQEYYGDYNHFVTNKAREWGDVCGVDRHVCRVADYPGADLNADPTALIRRGPTTRLNRFVDHYAKPQGNPAQPPPALEVVASLQVCDETAGLFGLEGTDGGPQFNAPTFGRLAPGTLTVDAPGSQSTTSKVAPNPHAARSDPVGNSASNGAKCVVESSPSGSASAGPGVATYDSAVLDADATMIGRTRIRVDHTGQGSGMQLNARLYDLDVSAGRQILVDRAPFRVTQAAGTSVWDLHGNGWRFAKGHRIRVEVTQDDSPFIKASTQPSSLTLSRVRLEMPVREGGRTLGGGPASAEGPGGPPGFGQRVRVVAPTVASNTSTSRRFTVVVAPLGARSAELARYQVQVRRSPGGRYTWLRRGVAAGAGGRARLRFNGVAGRTYRFRARAVARNGEAGAWAPATVVVPLDEGAARYSGRWSRPRARGAFLGRVRRSATRGARARIAFRGDRLYVVGTRGPAGGTATVLVDGRRAGTLRSRARRTRRRAVLFSRAVSARRAHRLTIVVRSGRVELDAFAFRR